MSGFVVIRREALEHHLVGDARYFRPWCWLIANACWKPTKFNNMGKTITLERGQLCVTVRQLAAEWGMSKSAVDRLLKRFESEAMVERKAGQGRMVLTIRNYSKYQDIPSDRRDKVGTRLGQERDTKEQGNKGTKDITPLNPPKPEGVSDQIWRDWKRIRKKPVTASVLKRTEAEAAKIGWTLAQAITEAAESGWQGFKAEYVKETNNDNRRQGNSNQRTAELAAAKLAGLQ